MRKPAASRNLTEHQDIPEDGIPARTILGTDDMKVMLFTVSADQELPERTASMPAVVHFIWGNARLSPGEDTIEARPGTWIYVPPKLKHGIRAVDDEHKWTTLTSCHN